MPHRTIRTTVTFQAPFRIPPMREAQPPGTYDVETDEEGIEGNARTIWRRTATLLYLTENGATRTVTLDPADLAAALARDQAMAPFPSDD